MTTVKYLLFGAMGLAVVLLLTSDKAKQMRDDLEEKTKDNAKKWKHVLGNLSTTSASRLAELKKLLGTEMEGLSDDARKRLQAIADGTANTASKFKRDLNNQVS